MIQRIPGLPASDMDDVFEQLVVYQVLMRTTPTIFCQLCYILNILDILDILNILCQVNPNISEVIHIFS